MPIIKLKRSYLPDDSCVIGELILPCGWSCLTMEKPWQQNQPNISCIPEGTYLLGKRFSPIVQRTSRDDFSEGYEIQSVPGRTFIMFHPGNYVGDTEGCLLPGQTISRHSIKGLMVTNSRLTFRELMKRLDQHDNWQIQITTQSGGVYG